MKQSYHSKSTANVRLRSEINKSKLSHKGSVALINTKTDI
jgi:hypothetical protein